MGQDIEYHDSMIKMLEMIWGEGFMAPGSTGNVDRIVADLDLRGKRILDIGCGLGGPDHYLAETYGALTTGIDLEPQLIEIALARTEAKGLQSQCEFMLVEPGTLPFADGSFDLVISSGAFTQVAEKSELFGECLSLLDGTCTREGHGRNGRGRRASG